MSGLRGSPLPATVASLLIVALCLLAPATASAAFGLSTAGLSFEAEDGSAASLAGSHPFALSTTFKLNTRIEGGKESPDGSLKDLEVALPVGLAGIPKAVPQCSGADFATLDEEALPQPIPLCSNDSAIGYVSVGAAFKAFPIGGVENGGSPLYNLVPPPGSVAKFGFIFAKVPVTIEVKLSEEAPYRVVAILRHAPQPLLLYGSTVTVWGNPASHTHDPLRGSCFDVLEPDGTPVSQGNCPVSEGTLEEAFLTAPRACLGPLQAGFLADSWEEPAVKVQLPAETRNAEGAPVGFEGCDALGFNPSISTSTSSAQAESPTGLDFGVQFNGNAGIADPNQRADSDLQKIVAKLPEGVTLNASAGDGLVGCTTAQLEAERLTTPPGAACPQAAKIGTITATSPLVDEPLEGAIFAATPNDPATTAPHQENPFDSFLAIYLVLRNQNLGVIVKQAGRVEADPQSGRLTATFEEAPQLPISRIDTHFREGPRAPLVTPGRCGNYTAEALETSWAGKQVVTTAEFNVSSGPGGSACPSGSGPIGPAFEAGTTANAAGSYAPFTLHLTRRDGEANLTHLSVGMPEGLTGRLAGIGRCPDASIASIAAKGGRAELASPSCPASSRIGSVVAGAGVGPALTYVRGAAYLAGPYLGAPFSILAVTPAVAGPFDLGNVVIREPLRIDLFTAQVSVDGSASPLPRILKGIPLQLRDLRINIDRPGFILNPSSCEPKVITATATGAGPSLSSAAETSANLAAHYQAANCSALAFKPKLKLRLKGATKRSGHPALRAVLTYPAYSATRCAAQGKRAKRQGRKAMQERRRAGRLSAGGAKRRMLKAARRDARAARELRQGAKRCLTEAPPREANIARAQVGLPHSEFLDQGNLDKVCKQADLKAGTCPKTSIYGRAKAWTPLLDKPLEGPVYLGVGFGYKLPALVADLNGQVRILLKGRVDTTKHHGIRSTFEAVPDAPVSRFVLEMKGGKKYGLLENSENTCRKPQFASARFISQNNRVAQMRPKIANSCKKKHGRKHRAGKQEHRGKQKH